jgi:hypothetical protein
VDEVGIKKEGEPESAFGVSAMNYLVICMTPFMSSQWPGKVHM